MTTIQQVVTKLHQLDIKLSLRAGKLHVNAPQGVLTPELRTDLANRKGELLAFLQQQLTLQPIRRADHQGAAPLSSAQQRLWFLAQLQTTGTTYHLATLLQLTGELRIDALEASLRAVVARHEILRTTYAVVDGLPVQCVGTDTPVTIAQVDLAAVPADQRQEQVFARTAAEQARHFDLATGPLWRFLLFRLDTDHYLLAIIMHHLITDEWSTNVLVREISHFYTGFVTGAPTPLPPLLIQYADYATWQREQLTSAPWQAQLQALCAGLADATPIIQLPLDYGRPVAPTLGAATVPFVLDAELTAQLKTVAQAGGTTLYTTLLAAYAALLARYSGQHDLVIGSPVANRERQELEGLIGFLVNTLALRITLADKPSFRTLLAQVRGRVLDGVANLNIPFEQLVEALQPDRHLNLNPLFQTMFVWQNALREVLELPDLQVELVELPITSLPVDLLLAMREADGQLLGQLRYSTDLFTAQTAGTMVAHFQTLLAALVCQPDQPIATLPLYAPARQQQLLAAAQGPVCATLPATPLHELFAAQVLRTPTAPAIYDQTQVVTYAELNAQANQLAHLLLAQGHGPGERIAICTERSTAMLIAIFAVLKIGAAYVPLDPDYPAERLAYMLTDAQVTGLIAQAHLAPQLPLTMLPVLWIEQVDWGAWPTTNPTVVVKPTDQIYQIYTSGSTGLPKGVVVAHQGVANTIRAIAERIALGPNDRLFQFVPMGFDAAAIDFFAPLSCGAALVLHPNPTRLSAEELLQLCCQQGVTVVNFTVALWQQWVDNLVLQGKTFPSHLRVFLTGGDKPSAQTLRTWATLGDHPMRYCCSYGPTEASITTTFYTITNDEVQHNPPALIPLGPPLPNMAIYLLDGSQQLVPHGVPGEIYIGGVGVADGYWQRPALTAERFVEVPSFDPSATLPLRLYRSGDLARWRPDGSCEFVGRVDTQVKIRGFRIELGEIESQLKGLPTVREAVVVAHGTGISDKRIVAYVQPFAVHTTEFALASELKQQLPDHMLPAAWVMMERWPFTPNGKIDRQALPQPSFSSSAESYVAPSTALEQTLAAIWQAVLGVEQVGVTSNFFVLGGHSLLATQVVARIGQQLGLTVALRTLFEKPTIAELAATLTTSEPSSARPPLVPIARTGPVPLSFAQQRLWLIGQLDPASSGYSIPGALRLTGQLDPAALERALNELVARHESLRTIFAMQDGEPVQIIQPGAALPFTLVDLRHLPQGEREAAAQAHAAAAMREPFDLGVGPLLCCTLYQLADDEAILFVLMHHIITDGWSIPILMGEVVALYAAQVQGISANLPPLAIQYADYAHWQRAWLQGNALQDQIDYWREQLTGAPPLLALPTDHSRPAQPTYQADTLTFTLEAGLVQGLNTLAQAHGATPYMAVLSAFALLLARYSRQQDLVIGTPIANRTHPAVESLIGFFVNTLALRIDLAGQPTFVELLGRVRQQTLGAYAHQDAPFEGVIEALQLARNRSHAPLFQVLLAWQSAPNQGQMLELPGLTLAPVAWQKPTIEYDLVLSVAEDGETLGVTWQYSTDLFARQTIVQMVEQFQTLLAAIVAQPTQAISTLPLFTAAQVAQIVAAGSGPVMPQLGNVCLHQLFEVQVLRTPTAPAICYQGQVVTYNELNVQANRLAHLLIAQGHGRGERIAICLDRSPQLLVAILAVLKIGAAYVPLDADYPTERLAYLLDDAAATLLITHSGLATRLPIAAVPVCSLDQTDLTAQPSANPAIEVSPTEPFYQIYTSGSTGLPKGVVVAHQGIANTVQSIARKIDLGPGDRLFQFVPLGFDAAALELFAPLSCGAAVVLHPTPTRLSTAELISTYRDNQVTVSHLSTAAWQQLVNNLALQGERFPNHLRACLIGGEKPAAQTLRTWATLGDHPMTFVSSYGPSEASIVATSYVTTNHAVLAAPPTMLGLGEPLPNVAIYLLDEAGQLVPNGVPGELYIGGIGVAQGYWQRPDLTAERFVPHILDTTVPSPSRGGLGWGKCLYRTGDLARRLVDGTYEFVGRVDTQVKIRGFRIELGEIENQLKHLAAVREAVVLAVEAGGDKRIVAYIQPFGATTSQSQLADELQQRLPPHMLPAAWVLLEEWPLTPNGKIDRQRLPAPTFTVADVAYVAPRTVLERELAAIWQAVLGLEQVGVTTSFFDLGGHSLSATQVVARIGQQLGLAVGLRTLFDKPTIAELAAELSAAQPALARPPINRVARDGDLPLSFGQQRLWLMQQLNPTSGFFNMPAALWLDGTVDHVALQAAFDAMAARHEMLRTTFPLVDGRPVQQIAAPAGLPVVYHSMLDGVMGIGEAELIDWVATEAAQPFDLQQGPLVRVVLRQVDHNRHLLLVNMHHIIGDDWSRRLFMQEFSTLYRSYIEQASAVLAPLAIQYADFAQWQRDWLQGPVLDQQLDYWRTQLADAPPLLELPTDRPRPPQQRFVGERLVVTVDADLAEGLRAFSRQQQSTLHMTLLAGFAALLSRYSGMTDLVIGIPVAGRTDPALEGLIGFFLNTLALRIRLHDEPNFTALLAAVKQVTLDGYAHQDAPFEQVIEALNPTPQLSHTPIFQVMFDLAQADQASLDLPGLQVQPVAFDLPTAKFDLNLVFSETADATALTAVWEYNSDIFDRATIAQLARHLQALLQAALAAPTQPVTQLPLLTVTERQQLIEGWNPISRQAPVEVLMQQLFEAQVLRTPDAIAAYYGDQTITYASLNERANRWAHQLIAHGVTADVIVTPFWARDLDFLTAILAIFKAGGAYLPLDPGTPSSRIGQIIAQSRTPVVLTNRDFLPLVAAALATVPTDQRPTLCLVEELDAAAALNTNPPVRNTLDSLAYVIFTSGSTGVPKGVMVEQRGLVNHLAAMQQNLALTAADLIGQTATQSYVISVWQFLAALTFGGALRIVPEETLLDPAVLVATIEIQAITIVQVVPSLLRLMIEALEQQNGMGNRLLPGLRWLIPTGEALPPALARRWFAVCPQIPLLNAYGSSECSDDVAHDLITLPPSETTVTMPIGWPIANVQTYVLDAHQQPVPLGVAGELYVGGRGVGRGYLHDPEKTGQVFLPNPFTADPAARLYKTGDRVRRLTDGNIEYLGRFDFQVKVRGIRVELGEIEAMLGKHAGVAQSVVMTTADRTGQAQLVAYVVPRADAAMTPTDLRLFLGERLPDYMVPPTIMLLEHFPLNASGKVARRLLPAPTQLLDTASQPYVAPRNEVETTLVEILATVLGLDVQTLGVQHNFFDLGGHSMQAIQIVWQLRDRLGVELPLRSIFEQTTVERLANLVIDAQLAQIDDATLDALFAEVEAVG